MAELIILILKCDKFKEKESKFIGTNVKGRRLYTILRYLKSHDSEFPPPCNLKMDLETDRRSFAMISSQTQKPPNPS